MSWDFNDDRPIYMQLMEQIQLRIISGIYKVGEKLPSVRDMASDASVNPNTMQKALIENISNKILREEVKTSSLNILF